MSEPEDKNPFERGPLTAARSSLSMRIVETWEIIQLCFYFDCENLILLAQKRLDLRDHKQPNYPIRNVQKKLWDEVSKDMNESGTLYLLFFLFIVLTLKLQAVVHQENFSLGYYCISKTYFLMCLVYIGMFSFFRCV